jgi:hypothetical protein
MAYKETPRRVAAKLYFDRLPELKGRQGFVDAKQYRAIADNCRDTYLRAILALAYSFGFRRGELLSLKVSDCDLLGGTIRLRTSKNGEPRTVPLTAETRGLLASCISGKSADESVFTRNGKAVTDFRGSRDRATTLAGCPGLLFHDLRRSAVRNMVRGGIPEVVCMKISGHKTRAVFDRYNIVSGRDLADAAEKIEPAQLSYRQAKEDKERAKCYAPIVCRQTRSGGTGRRSRLKICRSFASCGFDSLLRDHFPPAKCPDSSLLAALSINFRKKYPNLSLNRFNIASGHGDRIA